MSAIRHWHGLRLDVDAAVVMPDHVHLIFRIPGGLSLSAVLQSLKGYSARAINALLGRKGPFWLDESFDHIIRHEQEWEEKNCVYTREPCHARPGGQLARVSMALDQRMTGWKVCPTLPTGSSIASSNPCVSAQPWAWSMTDCSEVGQAF